MFAFLFTLALTVTASARASLVSENFPQIPSNPAFEAYVASMVGGMGNATNVLRKDRGLARVAFAGCGEGEGASPSVGEDEAYAFSRYAAASYCILPSVLREWSCRNHCTDASTQGTTDVEVHENLILGLKFFVAANHPRKSVIISFRGSLTPQSLAVDAAAFRVAYEGHHKAPEGATVHAGFLAAYRQLASRVKELALPLVRPGYTIDVTGHSMGGALAVLCALDLHDELGSKNIRVFTFGEPRMGNRIFADFVTTAGIQFITRVTNQSDLIPNLPPKLLGYAHHCGELHLQEDGQQPPCSKRECRDAFCEDAQCVQRNWWKGNMIHHLKAWDVVFGPWC